MLEQIPRMQKKFTPSGNDLHSEKRLSVLYYELKHELICFGYHNFEEFQHYVNSSDDPTKTMLEWQVHANRR